MKNLIYCPPEQHIVKRNTDAALKKEEQSTHYHQQGHNTPGKRLLGNFVGIVLITLSIMSLGAYAYGFNQFRIAAAGSTDAKSTVDTQTPVSQLIVN